MRPILDTVAPPNVAAASMLALGAFCRCAWNVAADAMAKSAIVCSEKNELYPLTADPRGHSVSVSLGGRTNTSPGAPPVHGRARWTNRFVTRETTSPRAIASVALRAYCALRLFPSCASSAQIKGSPETATIGTQNATGDRWRRARLVRSGRSDHCATAESVS